MALARGRGREYLDDEVARARGLLFGALRAVAIDDDVGLDDGVDLVLGPFGEEYIEGGIVDFAGLSLEGRRPSSGMAVRRAFDAVAVERRACSRLGLRGAPSARNRARSCNGVRRSALWARASDLPSVPGLPCAGNKARDAVARFAFQRLLAWLLAFFHFSPSPQPFLEEYPARAAIVAEGLGEPGLPYLSSESCRRCGASRSKTLKMRY